MLDESSKMGVGALTRCDIAAFMLLKTASFHLIYLCLLHECAFLVLLEAAVTPWMSRHYGDSIIIVLCVQSSSSSYTTTRVRSAPLRALKWSFMIDILTILIRKNY